MQHICNEMNHKAYEFMNFQRAYYTNKADNRDLLEQTTQPFWQSMCLSKRRLASKGLAMDVEIREDRMSKTVEDERLCMRRDGHHLVGTKAMNVIAKRTFYKDGKPLSTFKKKEICNMALLKSPIDGDKVACPNCGHINTIDSYTDGCDACGSKFTVQDFETKVSGFSLEENTSGMIKSMLAKDMLFLGILILGCILSGMFAFGIFWVASDFENGLFINDIDLTTIILLSTLLQPVICGGIVVFGLFYLVGAWILISAYEERIVHEELVKKFLPTFSAGDFYQNLEYKLRNIHLTDRAEDVSAFARCDLKKFVADYKDVVECDMSRLKFKSIKSTPEGCLVEAEANLRLTEYDGKYVSIKYEKLNLTLFGKHQVISRSVVALREYKCPGCGSSINILEGGRCNYCGNTFDYSAFGWVIESYESKRHSSNAFQKLRNIMMILFILNLCWSMIFPCGFNMGSIFEGHGELVAEMEAKQEAAPDLKTPKELYKGLTKDYISYDHEGGGIFQYRADVPEEIAQKYKEYLASEGLDLYKEVDNGYVFCREQIVHVNDSEKTYYYIVAVAYWKEYIVVDMEFADYNKADYLLESTVENLQED